MGGAFSRQRISCGVDTTRICAWILRSSDWADVVYRLLISCQAVERTLLWNDPDLGITWPVPTGELPIPSAKDPDSALRS
jgi:hypothetical protein